MGAAGVLAYLVSLDKADSTMQAAIAHLLAYLLWLGEAGQPLGKERWYISPDLLPTDMHRQHFPRGYFDCGLAHGIPGPLAALALTWLAGYRYPGLREAIASLADWIVAHRSEQEWGSDWPASVPLECATASLELAAAFSHSFRLVLRDPRCSTQSLAGRTRPGKQRVVPERG